MDPYFQCVSLPGYFSNRCGNCMYSESAEKCEYEKNKERWDVGQSGADPGQGYRHRRTMSGGQVASPIPSNIARVQTSIWLVSDHIEAAKVDARGKYASWYDSGVSYPVENNKFVTREDYRRLEIKQAEQEANQDRGE
ncbi:hypothetical protein CLIM01_14821 [Colletotrichum limetticola]|uniref:Pre-mRNA-splicing factor SLU7 n=1 Tax=Colletotrichum limetticola TaxID=1209924 RepID=A0ABQ9P6T2_9PEZI|nr:hypothetical protein CLIM01_14821 [Colletotrichum limetticola]